MHRAIAAFVAILVTLAIIAPAFAGEAKPAEASAIKHFESHIRPLLAQHCLKCHGDKKQQGGLRLDRPGDLLTGGDSGPAIEPGKPDESLLMEAVRYESYEMPPDGQLDDEEIAHLEQWIAAGAPWPDFDPEKFAQRGPADKFSDEDRAFWSFQPLERPALPQVDDHGWSRNEIDRFVYRKLHEKGLHPAKEASKLTLLRRACFDLTGLPPTPEQMERFLADDDPRAYERLIDRLLDSPAYGERWARHWLDLVRYAESDGFRQDAFRPHAWRYRDYVIDSFNDDKPYSQFVTEQLAGDETAPHDPDALIATGYLRHWIYEYNQRDVRTQWTDILNDITDTTGDVFLAMGFSCARCHDHKFDPILRKDYYRLQAFFTPILPRDDVPAATPDEIEAYETKYAEWAKATAEIRSEIEELERPYRDSAAESAIQKFPPDIEAMLRKPYDQRKPLEVQLTDLAYNQIDWENRDVAGKLKGEKKERYEELQEQLAEFDQLKPKALPTAYTASDVGAVAPATMIPGIRKEHNIEPGYLTMLAPDPVEVQHLAGSTGRRTALAEWITRRDNPLTWRVIVNRIWQQHFGRGIVSSTSDFGRLGTKPTHPELLDWLAAEFLDSGESMKALHRLIMTSATYRQSSLRIAGEKEDMVDPTSELLWRMTTRRLDAEQIRDAMLATAGRLSDSRGGPSDSPSSTRRSIYCKTIRNSPDPLLKAFDTAAGFSSESQRNVTITPTQSLLMINGDFTLSQASALARRAKEKGSDQQSRVRYAYVYAFGREPTAEELQLAESFLNSADEPTSGEPAKPKEVKLTDKFSSGIELPTDGNPRRVYLKDSAGLPTGNFTLEAVVQLESLYADATVRTIAAQWDSDTKHPGWAVGVTSTKSRYTPRNLILQLVAKTETDALKYEVVPSGLHLELKRPYYVAVSVNLTDTKQTGVTFYLKDLSKTDAELQTAGAAHSVVKGYTSEAKFIIGGRHRSSRHLWHGGVAEVRLAGEALSRDQLFIHSNSTENIVGHWQFNDGDHLLANSLGDDRRLTFDTDNVNVASADEKAWIDFCHVLLNSNEFLYVD